MSLIMDFLAKITGGMTLRDYRAEINQIERGIAVRYARGNVTAQQGRILYPDDLDALAAEGDAAARRLAARFQ